MIYGENVTYIISLNEQIEREWEKVKYGLRTCINDWTDESRQKEALKNYDIDKWFIEKVSGKDIKRPKLREMLEYIREDATVYVIGI